MSVSGYSLMHTTASFALPRQPGVTLKIILIRVVYIKIFFGVSESVAVI